jgi:hypothetical protein
MKNLQLIITFVDQVQPVIEVEMIQQYIFHLDVLIVPIAVRLFHSMS